MNKLLAISLLSLLMTGCIPSPSTKSCLYVGGYSQSGGSVYLVDDWGRGEWVLVMSKEFWDKSYPVGSKAKFDVKWTLYNSGYKKIDAVKYVGECK